MDILDQKYCEMKNQVRREQTKPISKEIKNLKNEIKRLNNYILELEENFNKDNNCLHEIHSFILKYTDLSLEPGKIADFKRWKKLLIKLIAY